MNVAIWINFLTFALWLAVVLLHLYVVKREQRLRKFHIRIEALVTKRTSYQAENWMRDRKGLALAYGEEHFDDIQRELEMMVRLMDRGLELVVPKTAKR